MTEAQRAVPPTAFWEAILGLTPPEHLVQVMAVQWDLYDRPTVFVANLVDGSSLIYRVE